MALPAGIVDLWNAYAESVGGVDETRFYEAFFFTDDEESANALARLVLAGTKRATAGSAWSFEAEGRRPPMPGDLSVVTDWAGVPKCIIETISVEIVAFAGGRRLLMLGDSRPICNGGLTCHTEPNS